MTKTFRASLKKAKQKFKDILSNKKRQASFKEFLKFRVNTMFQTRLRLSRSQGCCVSLIKRAINPCLNTRGRGEGLRYSALRNPSPIPWFLTTGITQQRLRLPFRPPERNGPKRTFG